ncbi:MULTISPECIES: alpha/beta hydrolase [unclassified Pseudofrankia]|uniref:alpha/beta hydrolase n=1 Tax=unclassified Pseudofrankia TaxID=2994372 RepID=UPI0009F63F1F|nr:MULTISPECIES: alpha/beta fold hydrolase [unclassified Pseudofrankia]MDT3438691.1 alpha/beta fold hydrolase [Pseudofrankia sp. BMG5.37]
MFHRAPTVYRLLPTADAEILATAFLDHGSLVGSVIPPPAVVLVPGFSGTIRRPAVRSVAEGLRWHASVVMVETRGHGRSTGTCTFGDREVLDVDAAVGEARRLGHERVVTVGWSMGGAAVVRHAALASEETPVHGHRLRNRPDAVVTVSATSRWFVRDTAPLRRILWMAETRTGRLMARTVFGVRIPSRPWPELPSERPPAPVDLIGQVAPTPLLIVHGDLDGYFTLDHPRALAAAAGPRARLWIVPGFGHAETGVVPGLVDRIGRYLPYLLDGHRHDSMFSMDNVWETSVKYIGHGPGSPPSPAAARRVVLDGPGGP